MPRAAQCFGVRHLQPELFHYLSSAVSPILVVICLLIHHHDNFDFLFEHFNIEWFAQVRQKQYNHFKKGQSSFRLASYPKYFFI